MLDDKKMIWVGFEEGGAREVEWGERNKVHTVDLSGLRLYSLDEEVDCLAKVV